RQRAASVCRIGRDAFARSISPRQKRSNPPPVPEMPTVTRTPLFFFWKSSAAAVVYGPTVLDPSAVIVPLSAAGRAPAVATTAAAATAARDPAAAIRRFLVIPTPLGRTRTNASSVDPHAPTVG